MYTTVTGGGGGGAAAQSSDSGHTGSTTLGAWPIARSPKTPPRSRGSARPRCCSRTSGRTRTSLPAELAATTGAESVALSLLEPACASPRFEAASTGQPPRPPPARGSADLCRHIGIGRSGRIRSRTTDTATKDERPTQEALDGGASEGVGTGRRQRHSLQDPAAPIVRSPCAQPALDPHDHVGDGGRRNALAPLEEVTRDHQIVRSPRLDDAMGDHPPLRSRVRDDRATDERSSRGRTHDDEVTGEDGRQHAQPDRPEALFFSLHGTVHGGRIHRTRARRPPASDHRRAGRRTRGSEIDDDLWRGPRRDRRVAEWARVVFRPSTTRTITSTRADRRSVRSCGPPSWRDRRHRRRPS